MMYETPRNNPVVLLSTVATCCTFTGPVTPQPVSYLCPATPLVFFVLSIDSWMIQEACAVLWRTS